MAGVEKMVSIVWLREILMLDQVDAGNGMLFGTATAGKAEPRKNALTLVIGVGGSGAAAVAEAVKLADRRFIPEYRNFVDFLVVDSDVREIEQAGKNGNVRTLHISTSGLKHRMELCPGCEYRPEFFRKFMPADYETHSKLIGCGAGADRMTGKLKLYDRTEDGCTTNDVRFQDMIEELFHGKWSVYRHLPVDIVILTGISGGTGSGTFMDLAARAKQACRMAGVAEVKVYGYIMLPDTAEELTYAGKWHEIFYQNGYAALKELESYMSIGFNRERKEVIASAVPIENVTIDWKNMLFDYSVLVSGGYKKAVSMIAETVVASVETNSMSLNGCLYGNLALARQMALSQAEMCENGALKRDACPEDSHQYCGIGYACADIPEKIVIPNVVGKVCRRMYANTDGGAVFCSGERKLTKLEFRDALNILFSGGNNQIPGENVLLRRIDDRLRDLSVLPQNLNVLTYVDVVENRIEEWEAAFGVPAIVKRGRKDIEEYITTLYEEFTFRAGRVMVKYGPRAMENLYYGAGSDDPTECADSSIRQIMEEVKEYLLSNVHTQPEHPEPLPEMGRISMVLNGRRKVDAWKIAKEDAIQADIRMEIARAMCGGNGIWIEEYQNKVEHFIQNCSHFADVLESMTEYYETVGKSLDASDFTEFAMEMGSNEVNLCSDQKTYEWIKKRVLQKVESIDPDGFRQMLIDDFTDHPELWCSCEEGVARKHYDELMSNVCQLGVNAIANNGLNLSVRDYFIEILSNVPLSEQNQKIDQAVEQIMEVLMRKSQPSLRIRRAGEVNKIVIVPQSLVACPYGGQIFGRIQAYLAMRHVQIIVSPATDAIVSYQASVANALSDLVDLPKWEEVYDRLPSNTKHLNCGEYVTQYKELSMTERDELEHVIRQEKITPEDDLLGTTGLSWEHYPSVNLLAYQWQFTGFDEWLENSSEAQYRQNVFEKKIEYALKEKIIECKEVSLNAYQYWVNLIPEDWNNLNVDNWMECEEERCVRGWKLFEFLHRQNLQSSATYRKQIVLTGSPVFGEFFGLNAIIQLQHWDDARIEQEHQSYMKRIMRKNTALYMELEETLYRYYDIRKALEEKEKN